MGSAGEVIELVDIAGWRTRSDPDVADRLVRAFRTTGFATIVGHGMPGSTRDAVFAAARRFFALDPVGLDSVHHRHVNSYRGYIPLRSEQGHGANARYECFDCGLELPDTYHGPGAALRSTPNLWPDLAGFRPAVERYRAEVHAIADSVLGAVASGLGQSADFFRRRCTEPLGQLRLLHYPRQPDADDSALSAGQHSDYEALTILAQDDVGGLEVLGPDGAWLTVEPVESAFVVNVGEMLTRWTNGTLPATPHRVRSPRARDRYSIAFFYGTDYDSVIEPMALPAAGTPIDRYEPVTVGAYLERRFSEVGT